MDKEAIMYKTIHLTRELDFEMKKKLLKCYIWSFTLYGAQMWTLRKNTWRIFNVVLEKNIKNQVEGPSDQEGAEGSQ